MRRDRRPLQEPADEALDHRPSFQAADEELLREKQRRGAGERIDGHGLFLLKPTTT
jgi:hypothetical protein